MIFKLLQNKQSTIYRIKTTKCKVVHQILRLNWSYLQTKERLGLCLFVFSLVSGERLTRLCVHFLPLWGLDILAQEATTVLPLISVGVNPKKKKFATQGVNYFLSAFTSFQKEVGRNHARRPKIIVPHVNLAENVQGMSISLK